MHFFKDYIFIIVKKVALPHGPSKLAYTNIEKNCSVKIYTSCLSLSAFLIVVIIDY